MSVETPHRKRKHAPKSPAANDLDHDDAGTPAKKQRKEHHKPEQGSKKRDKKGKGKETTTVLDTSAADTANEAANRSTGEGKEFTLVSSALTVSIPPLFASNPRAGVEEMLDSMLMRYIPALRGVVLSHSNLTFLDSNATIKADCPFAVCRVTFDAMVWSPRIGMKLEGKINLCSPDHVSLLIHRTFNISIPRHHIPVDQWEFEYGPASNDPEFGEESEDVKPKPKDENEEGMDVDGEASPPGGDEAAEHSDPGGRWVHKKSGQLLGGEAGVLEFNVVGMTVANEMLSLTGSIQPDPFSPEHQRQTSVKPSSANNKEEEEDTVEPSPLEKKKKSKKSKAPVLSKEDAEIDELETESVAPPAKKKGDKKGEKAEKKAEKKLKRAHEEDEAASEAKPKKKKKKEKEG